MIGYLFSGQGSQKPHMTDELCSFSKAANELVNEASEFAGFDLKSLDDEQLAQTRYAQLSIVSTSLAVWTVWQEKIAQADVDQKSVVPAAFAGFSLGEYSMLAAAGILNLKDLIGLVSVRSKLMQEAAKQTPGAMYAILGLESEQIDTVLNSPELANSVYAVNFNCPGQTVISGLRDEAAMAAEALKTMNAKRCLKLNVSGAFHTRFMQSAATELEKYARNLDFGMPEGQIYSNLTAKLLPGSTDWPAYLASHLCEPVYWSQEVSNMKKAGVSTMFEMGYGKVLTGLVRKIDREISVWPVENKATLDEAWQAW